MSLENTYDAGEYPASRSDWKVFWILAVATITSVAAVCVDYHHLL